MYSIRGMKVSVFILVALFALFSFENDGFSIDKILMMATTTSTDNTGLLDYIEPYIMADTGIKLQWTAVGTGKALLLGHNCDVDIVMVHDPKAEEEFVKKGYGINRHKIMYNDFVIIGSQTDPAHIKGKPVTEALNRIASRKVSFVSRCDDSGTHKKERSLWKNADLSVPDKESWYYQTGEGMLSTITIAEELGAYTLIDRGTYITYVSNMKGNPSLVIFVENDPSLINIYSVIAINPDRCKRVRNETANEFIDWILSPKAQRLIGNFKFMGQQLFIPSANEK